MSQPTPYARSYGFTDFSTENPSAQQPGVQLDAQFDALELTTDEILRNLALIQRDDGPLANASVRLATLHSEVIAALTLIGASITAWTTATAYAAGNIVTDGDDVYLVAVAHTSGVLATDLAANRLIRVFDSGISSSLAASSGAGLVGWIQTVAAGAFGVLRSVMDKLRDHLDLRDFTGADPTGVSNSDTALQRATAEMIASGRPLRISRGDWLFTSSALSTASAAVLTDNIYIYGDGQGATRIANRCVAGVSLFNIGNSRFATLRDMTITGNGLTGALGNGHAIDMKNPGTIGVSADYPSHAKIDRVRITAHVGNALAYGGGTMPSCAIYSAGGLGHKVDHCYFASNSFGVYDVLGQQPTYDTCTFVSNLIAGLVNDRCENLRLINPDVVGSHGSGATALVTGSLGNLRVDAYGVQSAGGSLVKAGAVTDFYGMGSEYIGGKHKNHVYAAFSLYSPHQPLVMGAYIRSDVDLTCGVFYAYGARVIGNTFDLANPTAGNITNRYGVWAQAAGGYVNIGAIKGNKFIGNGGSATIKYGTAIFIDGSAAGGAAQSGQIEGNVLGDATGAGSAVTWDAFIRVTNVVGGLTVRDNHATIATNITVTVVYDFTGVTTTTEGLVDDKNSYLVSGGTVGTGKVQPTDYTGLQRTGYFNVVRLTVGGVQVLAGRVTGFGAMTGTGTKTTIATYTASITAYSPHSAGAVPVTSNAATDLDTVAAALKTLRDEVSTLAAAEQAGSRRLKALDDAARTHGWID